MQKFLNMVSQGKTLTTSEAYTAMEIICSNSASQIKIAAFLSIIHTRKETEDELLGFISYLRKQLIPVISEHKLIIDTCGTGGDHNNTFNISTAAALLVASIGIKVAKHGGRSVSSACGSADVLEALNIPTESNPQSASEALTKNGFIFLLASNFNHAYQKIRPLRSELGIRTCFNLMGPLLNPLAVKRQVIGVYAKNLLRPLANILQQLGSEEIILLHAHDNLDELSIAAPTDIVHLKQGKINEYTVYPETYGIPKSKLSELKGGDAATNASIIKDIFKGKKGAPRDSVILNAAAALIVAGAANSFEEGVKLANETIDSKRALYFLDELSTR